MIRIALLAVLLLASVVARPAAAQAPVVPVPTAQARVEATVVRDGGNLALPAGVTFIYAGEVEVSHCRAIATDGTPENLVAITALGAAINAMRPSDVGTFRIVCNASQFSSSAPIPVVPAVP